MKWNTKKSVGFTHVAVAIALMASGCTERPAVCLALPGTSEQIAATPRADREFELLAVSFSEEVTADQAVYDQLSRDLTAIRNSHPEYGGLRPQPDNDGKSLLIAFTDDQGFFRRLTYSDWDCLNEHFQSESIKPSVGGSVELTLKGIYNTRKIANLYAQLPDIKWAEPNSYPYTADLGPAMRVVQADGLWRYFFLTIEERTEGNNIVRSPRNMNYFTGIGDGKPKYVDTWQESDKHSAPMWVKKYWFGAETMRAFGEEIE